MSYWVDAELHREQWQLLVKDVPDSAGLYAVWSKQQLLYIGTATSLRKRLTFQHHRIFEFVKYDADRVVFQETPRTMKVVRKSFPQDFVVIEESHEERIARKSMESWLIEKHRPLLNHGSKDKRLRYDMHVVEISKKEKVA